MYCNKFVISSDCSSGPKEIIGENRGILFKNNSVDDFCNKINLFAKLTKIEELKLRINAKKFTKNFTLFKHYQNLLKIIEQ